MSREHEVTIDYEETDRTTTVTVAEDEYLLDAALDAGMELPYSCRSGNCTTCAGELREGGVDQSEGTALEPGQKDDGYALLCVSYPREDCEIRAGESVRDEMLGLDMDIF
ncbi:2Fe-2S iron-sulfur cluster-binding protein [Haladaptatus salinisoli]|uniref:2Fe-2S iron-sulfur cluster-binding protein n=1 Tax=Haladaptatus salinisoli TaxID=2884876 RepID=UPI001D0BCFAC|nr:2Fe-2S iron-sulfur cluster-binding protein [Haladaptatus salinisoli]